MHLSITLYCDNRGAVANLKMIKIVIVVKSQNVDFFTLKSQILTDNIFKYDFEFL